MRRHNHQTIAPEDALRLEFKMLQDREFLRTSLAVESMVFIQSLTGRAHEGHGTFRGRRYVDTDEDDVAAALNLDPIRSRQVRQALIDDIRRFVDRVLAGETPAYLLNGSGEPLLGSGTFRTLPINAAEVLGGLYLGGLRDTQEVRLAVEARFNVNIGTGKHFFVDRSALAAAGLTGEDLARQDNAGRIDEFRRAGIIVAERPAANNQISYMYIRHHRGPGASDDAAIVVAGRRYGLSAAAGVFLADAIDTLEKYVPPERYGDQDADLARHIQRQFPSLPFGEEQVMELTYLSIGGDERRVPDSSLRHLLRVDRSVDQCAMESHLLAAAGLGYAEMGLGHERVENTDFYALLDRRRAAFERSGRFTD
ncbi:MAG: hypothetical protein HY320_06855 [Armatimonadetes bacterium]|nr:hypothetical protein [Armatimonadota bacterium]